MLFLPSFFFLIAMIGLLIVFLFASTLYFTCSHVYSKFFYFLEEYKGGEDAYFIYENSFGVFDGVGGWVDNGVDPALYSKELSSLSSNVCVELIKSNIKIDPKEVMFKAWSKSKELGSSTACICTLDTESHMLRYANLGDSGLIILRKQLGRFEIIHRTVEQQHYFNCPFQLYGATCAKKFYKGVTSDHPYVSNVDSIILQKDDIVIGGSDGLFDNVFDQTIVEIVSKEVSLIKIMDAALANTVANKLAILANKIGSSTTGNTPFSVHAKNEGYDYPGGKLDDVTVIVAFVRSD